MSARLILALGGTVALLLACMGSFFYGAHVGRVACENHYAQLAIAAADAADKKVTVAQDNDAKAATADVARQTIVREITREVPKIIDRPVYRQSCVDRDGVQLITRAVDAANGRPPPVGADGDTPGVRPAAAVGVR